MTTIDEPFICMIRSTKVSGTTNSFKTNFNFTNNTIDKYREIKLKLKSVIIPHTISSGSSSETWAFADIKISGFSFSNLYDSSSDNTTIGFITNNQYSIKGDYCFENILSHELICDNPMSKLFTLYYTLYNGDFTTNSGTLNDSILIFELKPYLFDGII